MKHCILYIVLSLALTTTSKIQSPLRQMEEASDGGDKKKDEGNDNKVDQFDVAHSERVQKAYPALGYDLKRGPLWTIICITKEFGRIPGKLDIEHKGFFTYQYDVYNCEKFFKVNGLLIWNVGEIPEHCVARGMQADNEKPMYNTLAVTQYGNIPGKSSSPDYTVFSHEGIRFTSKTFYWVC